MTTCNPHHPANLLIVALPDDERRHFLDACQVVQLHLGEVLCLPGEAIDYAYFPIRSAISMTTPNVGYAGLEMASAGMEGMIGASLALGVDTSQLRVIVQSQGAAMRIDAPSFLAQLERSAALCRVVQRYACVLHGQICQLAACARFHLLEARLARWLLMRSDRAGVDAFHATHEFLADILGMRRASVTTTAVELQNHQLIAYHRGDIRILDRDGLLAVACDCYKAVYAIYAGLMGDLRARANEMRERTQLAPPQVLRPRLSSRTRFNGRTGKGNCC